MQESPKKRLLNQLETLAFNLHCYSDNLLPGGVSRMRKLMVVLIAALSLMPLSGGDKGVAQTTTDTGECLTEITFGFNGIPILAGDYLWFSSAAKIRPGTPGTTLNFWNQKIHFVVDEQSYDLFPPP